MRQPVGRRCVCVLTRFSASFTVMANLPRNLKTVERVLERLASLGWIERTCWFTSGDRPKLAIRWTDHGKAMIAHYIPILAEFGYPSKREFDAFNDILASTLRDWAKRQSDGS